MKTYLTGLAASVAMAISGGVFAGGDAPIEAAPESAVVVHQISMLEAEELLGQPDVTFYDVNTLELWADGYIPGSIFFNVGNWQDLLPKDKNAKMVFYCANRLCTSSETAAYEVMKLGYTNVLQMPDGIYGWKLSGRQFERP